MPKKGRPIKKMSFEEHMKFLDKQRSVVRGDTEKSVDEKSVENNKIDVSLSLIQIGELLDFSIVATPTGKAREALTDINILCMDLKQRLEELW